MKILVCGDVVGKSGREALQKYLPILKKQLSPDVIIVNGENAAHGFGITPRLAQGLWEMGIDCITSGNHIFSQNSITPILEQFSSSILRPLNYPEGTPGRGWALIQKPNGNLLVLNAMGRLFMDPVEDPFRAVDRILNRYCLGHTVQGILLDFHAEASSEKMAMGFYCDGRVSAVVGTHTHIPTADLQILPKGTAYQTDLGMCGDYRSVIGMDPKAPIQRFLNQGSPLRLTPAIGPGMVCGLFLQLTSMGRVTIAQSIRMGEGLLSTEDSQKS